MGEGGQIGLTRIKIAPGCRLSEQDLLTLLDFNHGSAGLDVSGCYLANLNLGLDAVHRYWELSYESFRYEPDWLQKDLLRDGSLRRRVDLSGGIYSKTHFNNSDLSGTIFDRSILDWADFEGANLTSVSLQKCSAANTEFGSANLTEAEFSFSYGSNCSFFFWGSSADLHSTRFHSVRFVDANFRSCNLSSVRGLSDRTILHRSWFDGAKIEGQNFDLLPESSLKDSVWRDAVVDRTRMTKNQLSGRIGDEIIAERSAKELPVDLVDTSTQEFFRLAGESYRELARKFSSVQQLDDASWAHRRQRAMQSRANRSAWTPRRPWRGVISIAVDYLIDWLSGYGESPRRTLAGSMILILVFAIPIAIFLPDANDSTFDRILRSILISSEAFFSLSTERQSSFPSYFEGLWVLEAATGLLMFGLFLWTISNRVSR